MKKIEFGTYACEAVVVETCVIRSAMPCSYGRRTIAYAVERFLTHSPRFREEITHESWQIRLGGGKKGRSREFCYLIPAVLMELPGTWVRVAGDIDAVGIKIRQVDLLRKMPNIRQKPGKTPRRLQKADKAA